MSRAKTGARGHTPMMEQYLRLKAQHEGSILLFRMGDFYETFYDDAELCSRVLGITLTSREKKGDNPIPLAGIPFHALDNYLVKLIDAGHTVAICEQVEDPKTTKGLVKRDVVEIISPGTVSNPALIRGDDNAFLLAVAPSDDAWGYALLDSSTGEFRCGQLPAGEILALPRRFRVGEVLLPEKMVEDGTTQLGKGAWNHLAATGGSALLFQAEYARQTLCDHFGVRGVEGLGLGDQTAAMIAAGAALRYLADRQRMRPDQITGIGVERSGDRLVLDRETIGHLELFEGLRAEDREATLFHHLNLTRTPMGRRELAAWLRAPLCDPTAIDARLDAVESLVATPTRLDAIRNGLKGIGDLERVASRIATRRALPHELAMLRAGLAKLPALEQAIEGGGDPKLADIASGLAEATPMLGVLKRQLIDDPPSHLRKGGVLKRGVHPQLDELVELASGGKRWLANYQEEQRAATGIASLKVSYNKVFGYYLEVTRAHLDKVPADYEEKQTLTGGKRFVTPALKQREQQILSAEDERIELETELYGKLVEELAEDLTAVRRVCGSIGALDGYANLAQLATSRGYVRPVVDASDALNVEGGRHPVIERIADEPFVPNDIHLDPGHRQLLLLTGPNMGGKSTYLRQAALFVVMAQMGSFVPAARAHIGVVDRLFTRVGASDNLARGQSTFLVEMSETANILRNATQRSLVILDEVGRGTSTDDGLALAWAITEYLHDGPVRAKTLFATHYHELTALAEKLARAANIQMEVKDWGGEILFLHRVVPGASDRSYGVHVAELAGVPPPVLARARRILDRREAGPIEPIAPLASERQPQLDLFSSGEREVLERLRGVDPDRLPPLEALQLLADLRACLEREER